MHWRRKWQPTPVFLPGESQGRGRLVGYHLWGRTESDTTEVTAVAAAAGLYYKPCGLKQQIFILSHFCRLEIQNQGVGRVSSPWRSESVPCPLLGSSVEVALGVTRLES